MIRPELTNVLLNQINSINYSIFGYDTDIDGWVELDKKVASSFEEIRKKTLSEDSISFISFADTELNSDKVYQWEVEADKGKFFYAFCEQIEELTDFEQINDYYFFKYVLSKTMEGGTEVERKLLANPKSAQLAYVLQKPFVYKIICSDNNSLTLNYNDNQNLLSVYIPKKWFEFNTNAEVTPVISNIDYHPIIFNKTHYVYEIGEQSVNIRDLRSSHADIALLKKYIHKLSELLIEQKVPIKNEKYCIEGFARLIISLAYLARIKECCVESIPGVVAKKGKTTRCLGVFIWGYKGDNSPYTQYFKIFAEKLCVCYAAKYIEPLKYVEKMHEAYVKSAKTAIMSRNMSHNLGSHVMAYLKQKLGSVADILQSDIHANNVLDNIYPNDEFFISNRTHFENQLQLPFLVGMGKFIGYLQERQDYIATIATDYIPYGAPVNFKDAIYDELNPDLRYLRHHDDDNNNRPYNILINYIAKSEGLSRENMIVEEQVVDKETNKTIITINSERDIRFGFISYKDGTPSIFGLQQDRQSSEDPSLSVMRTYNFSLPGGLVGRQAIFSIIENIIRNAAKHGDTSKVNNLDFIYDIIDGEELRLGTVEQSRLCDNAWRELYQKSKAIDDYYLLSITDNLYYNQSVIDNLNLGLQADYLENDQIATEYKGIKEIRISASWLRGEKQESVYQNKWDSSPNKKFAPLVSIELVKDNPSDELGHLRYIVAIKKVKICAIILDGFSDKEQAYFSSLKSKADIDCTVYKTIDLFKRHKFYDYLYIIVSSESVFKEIRPFTSNRLRIWDTKKYLIPEYHGIQSIQKEESDVIKKDFFDQLLKVFYGVPEEKIYIWDNKTSPDVKDMRIVVSSFDDNKPDAKYVYRKHHANKKDFNEYWEKCKKDSEKNPYSNVIFVDGITGDNSSDRLVRREILDSAWYYKHLWALKSRVAIFDERIFKNIHNLDELAIISGGGLELLTYSEILKKDPSTACVERIKDSIFDERKSVYNSFPIDRLEPLDKAETSEDLIRQMDLLNPSIVWGNHKTPYSNCRGVDVFSIVEDSDGNMSIVGCFCSKFDEEFLYKNSFGRLANIIKDESGHYKIKLTTEGQIVFKDKYDYISIHQGLLDKIYNSLGIKKDEKGKLEFTEYFYSRFMDSTHIIKKSENIIDHYLPRFIIHSGRAKPSQKDMPQRQPFVQFSAIEQAVKDCKFSLVELLDLARYQEDL